VLSILTQPNIVLPTGTVELQLAVNLYRETEESTDQDQAWATIRAGDDSESVEVFRWTSADTIWALYEDTIDIHDWNVGTVDLEFTADIPEGPGANHSSFFLDTLSLKPLVCE
jgi:hypothetical protein